jgi:hypothetical protein
MLHFVCILYTKIVQKDRIVKGIYGKQMTRMDRKKGSSWKTVHSFIHPGASRENGPARPGREGGERKRAAPAAPETDRRVSRMTRTA